MKKVLVFLLAAFLCLAAGQLLFGLNNAEIRNLLGSVTVRIDLLNGYSEVSSFGSGFFVSETGLVLTNFHVIEDHFRSDQTIRLKLQDGSTTEAQVVHWNVRRDWAVLQASGSRRFSYLEFSDEVEILDNIWAAGYPITGNFKIMSGTISAFQPDFFDEGVDYYDVSIPFDHGSSGGPVINEQGKVVGIVTAYYAGARGFDLIIPVHEVADEIYWLRFLRGSEAFVPASISGVEEVEYLGDSIRVTNSTGYDIWNLYLLTEEMYRRGDVGDDLLGADILSAGKSQLIRIEQIEALYPAVYEEWDSRLYLIAVDLDDDYYELEWYPDTDSWDIELTFDSFIGGWDPESWASTIFHDGDDEPEYLGDWIRLRNAVGAELQEVHLLTDSMLESRDFGENLIAGAPLAVDEAAAIRIAGLEQIYDAVYSEWNVKLHLLARDSGGEWFYRWWTPDSDSWDIVIGQYDFVGGAESMEAALEAQDAVSSGFAMPAFSEDLPEGFFRVANLTGYHLQELYLLNEEMWETSEYGENLIPDGLAPESSLDIDPNRLDGIVSASPEGGERLLRLVALDTDNDSYYREWYPEGASSLIILTVEDLLDLDQMMDWFEKFFREELLDPAPAAAAE